MSDVAHRLLELIKDFDYYSISAPRPPEERITLESTFVSLGYDSLDMVELTMELEDALEIELQDEIEGALRVGDLLNNPKILAALELRSID